MAITTYTEIQSAVSNWMTRADMAGEAADFISLAEAALNRELGPVEVDTTLTGTVSSRRIDLSALSIVAPIGLFLAQPGINEVEMTRKDDGTFPYRVSNGYPRYWAMDGTNIDFDCPLDQAYPFRFRYRQRFALSVAAPTNWLLTYHPDLYLAATIVWGGIFIQDNDTMARWTSVLNAALPSVRSIIAQGKRSISSVDPGLMHRPHYSYQDWMYQ
jgi:hypothetical protein